MNILSLTEENYLKAIFAPSGKATGRVLNRPIAVGLKINPATVTGMLRRLHDKNLIEYSRSGGATLAKTGKEIALKVVRKHRLWETCLVQKMEMTRAEVHEVAEQLEHLQSDKFMEQRGNK